MDTSISTLSSLDRLSILDLYGKKCSFGTDLFGFSVSNQDAGSKMARMENEALFTKYAA